MERKGFTAPEITWQFAFRDQHYKIFFCHETDDPVKDDFVVCLKVVDVFASDKSVLGIYSMEFGVCQARIG